MLTQCPDCAAVFKVRAEHLAAAAGFVECGACGAQFDALRRLADEPAPTPAADPPAPALPESDLEAAPEPASILDRPGAGPTFWLLDDDDREGERAPEVEAPDSSDAASESTAAAQAAPPDDSVADEASIDSGLGDAEYLFDLPDEPAAGSAESPFERPAVAATTLPPEEHEILFTRPDEHGELDDFDDLDDFEPLDEPGEDATVPERQPPAAEAFPDDPAAALEFDLDLDPDDVPEVIRREYLALHQRRSRLRFVWPLVILLLVAALAAQVGWWFRAELRAGVPALAPVYAELCARVDCSEPLSGDTAGIELVGRDVREHPRYLDALLVNATLNNRGDTTAAYPVIELGLYDSGGGAVGVRRFEPPEYLDQSIDINAGLPAGRSVYIVLEVAGAAERAVSFEFTFL